MISAYTIDIASNGSILRLKVVYGLGKFLRLEYTDGDLASLTNWKDLLGLIPLRESELIDLEDNPAVHIHFEAKHGVMSIHRQLLADYSSWYKSRFGFAPLLDNMSGRLMKQISRNIETNCSQTIEVRTIWQLILTNLDQCGGQSIGHPRLQTIANNINHIVSHFNYEIAAHEFTNY